MISGWQPSLLARDLTSMTESGAMNIHMNQAWADMQARQTLYMTPTMDFGNMIEYGLPSSSMNFLVDPRYTINQWQWNQNNSFNPWGGIFNWNNMGWNNNMWNNNMWNNVGWNGGNSSSASNSSGLTDTEKAYQRKYNKLLSLVKQLASDDSQLNSTRKGVLSDIATKSYPSGTTYEEKYNSLKAEYDLVDKDEIRKFLASNASRNLTIDGKESTNSTNSFYIKLQSVGYEFENSAVDNEIADLYRTISSITDKQENYQKQCNILSTLELGSYDILDIISSWNTQKIGSANSNEQRIMKLIREKYNAIKSGTDGDAARDSVKTGVISPFVNALVTKARGLKDTLDDASKTKIQAAITKLETAYSKIRNKVDTDLSEAFDELYVLTRKAAIAKLRADVNDAYGIIDPEVFGDDLFKNKIKNDTDNDLKAEGFTDTEINAANVNVQVSNDSGIYTQHVDETKPARAQLDSITGPEKYLTKATEVTGISGVTEAWIDKNTNKVYVVKPNADGVDEIYEVTGATVDNEKVDGGTVSSTKVTTSDITRASQEAAALNAEKSNVKELIKSGRILTKQTDSAIIGGVSYDVYKENKGDKRSFVVIDDIFYEWDGTDKGDRVSASDIEAAYNSARAAESTKIKIIEGQRAAYDIGEEIEDRLRGWTGDTAWDEIENYMEQIDSTTVMHMLRGYRDEQGRFTNFDTWYAWGSQGFFVQLATEYNDRKIPLIQTVIGLVINYAQENLDSLDSAEQGYVEDIIVKLDGYSGLSRYTKDTGKTLDKLVDELIKYFNITKP